MFDTWLFTALILGLLALCVILRGIRIGSQDDRLVAGTVAVTLVSMVALTLSIAWGTLIILDLFILVAIACFAVMMWTGKHPGVDHT
jgi:hypothetical protein